MRTIIPKDTRYVPLTQQPSCCTPTSISMVMLKLGIPLIPIELLGYHLGLRVNKKVKNLFWNARTGPKLNHGYGTQTMKKGYNENVAFKKLKIPLKATVSLIENFKSKKEIVEFISSRVNKNKDIIVFLASDALNNTRRKNGHACVIDKIYPKKDIVRIIDPSAKQAKWRELKIDKFIQAIKLHPTHNGRFLELRRVK